MTLVVLVVLDFPENFTEELVRYRVKKSKVLGPVGIVRVETGGLEERDIQEEGLCALTQVGGARAAPPSTPPHRRSLTCLS